MKLFRRLLIGTCIVSRAGVSSPSSLQNAFTFTVDTGYAIFRGKNTLPNTVVFLGLRYAEPPERFRAPAPLDTTILSMNKQIIDARNFPDFCVQGTTGIGDAGGEGSEDCLRINIYAPINATQTSNLPVLVYIHGGGFQIGNPAQWPFDQWIEQSPNVIIAAIYYRLDSLGFLAHPDFISNPLIADLNVGFLDQIEALKWVQKYIRFFGGDPSKVTIQGQSAGATSVELHMTANEPADLFRAGIAQSVYRVPISTAQQVVPLFEEFSALVGCPASIGDTARTVACLRNASISAIARAQDANKTAPYNLFRPVIDTKVIVDFPTRAFSLGKFKNVPVVIGATSNETLTASGNAMQALLTYFPSLTPVDFDQILTNYPLRDFSSSAARDLELTGDHSIHCAREIVGRAVTAKLNAAYAYRYNTPAPGTSIVEHSADNFILFNGTMPGFNGTTVFQPLNATQQALAEEYRAYLLSFIRTGDPNTFKLARSPMWPKYSSLKRIVLQEDFTSVNGSSSVVEGEPVTTIARCAQAANLVIREQA